MDFINVSLSDIFYTSCYCEENVYQLIEKVYEKGFVDVFCVFITNKQKQVEIMCQRKGSKSNNYSVVWDYHVIMILKQPNSGECYVYDIDSNLEFPTSFEKYTKLAFAKTNYGPRQFRVLHGLNFLNYFASDRQHMQINGRWLVPPPSYACIKGKQSKVNYNLDLYLDLEYDASEFGVVLNQSDFIAYFS